MTEPALPDAIMDENDYPTESFLEWLATTSDTLRALRAAADFFDNCGYGKSSRENDRLRLVTGGWSGCEDVLEALSKNLKLWSTHWREHHHGGKWVFALTALESLVVRETAPTNLPERDLGPIGVAGTVALSDCVHPPPAAQLQSFRHHKGGTYTLLYIARSSENRDEQMAVYVSHQRQHVWVRPLAMFHELVMWPDGVRRPRFIPLDELTRVAGEAHV